MTLFALIRAAVVREMDTEQQAVVYAK